MIVTKRVCENNILAGREIICDQCGHGENVKGGPCLSKMVTSRLYCSVHDTTPEITKIDQPERPTPEDHIVEVNKMVCDGLNTMET